MFCICKKKMMLPRKKKFLHVRIIGFQKKLSYSLSCLQGFDIYPIKILLTISLVLGKNKDAHEYNGGPLIEPETRDRIPDN